MGGLLMALFIVAGMGIPLALFVRMAAGGLASEHPSPRNPQTPSRNEQTSRFEAHTACGRCGTWAVHPWRQPSTKAPLERERHTIRAFDGGSVRVIESAWPPDERSFEVIRICGSCGNEWGQR